MAAEAITVNMLCHMTMYFYIYIYIYINLSMAAEAITVNMLCHMTMYYLYIYIGSQMAVRSFSLMHRLSFSPRKIPTADFCWRLSQHSAIMWLEGLVK
jgi:hypothetical protein